MDRQPAYRNCQVGRYSYGTPKLHFAGSGSRLHVGQFCSIADEVSIFLGGEHRADWITTYPFPVMIKEASDFTGHRFTKGDVVIGNDVWIGYGATVLSGTRIGDGAVIGARALVANDVPPYTVVSGNPARAIRSRFPEPHVRALLQIGWWDWPLDKIVAELPLLLSGDVESFIERHLGQAA